MSKQKSFETHTMDGPMPFTMYCARGSKQDSGVIVDAEGVIRVIPKADSGWLDAAKLGPKKGMTPRDERGDWSVWFLLSRAFVLSTRSLSLSERSMLPAGDAGEIGFEEAGKAMALASDARGYAAIQALKFGLDIPLDVFATERSFIDWVHAEMGKALESGKYDFLDGFTALIRTSEKLPVSGFPDDVSVFLRVLAKMPQHPPTKRDLLEALEEDARLARKEELWPRDSEENEALAKRIAAGIGGIKSSVAAPKMYDWAKHDGITPAPQKQPQKLKTETLYSEKTFSRMLKKTGFDWLP